MKKLFTKLACIAALAIPGAAFAYTGNTSTDSYTFDLASKSNVSIDAVWSDLTLLGFSGLQVFNANSLGWSLSGASSASSTLVDGPGIFGSAPLSLGVLDIGHYVLTLTGVWNNGSGSGIKVKGWVSLLDGDTLIGPLAETNTFVATPIAAVPEPETYAMLLAGLMMMGTIARRRTRK